MCVAVGPVGVIRGRTDVACGTVTVLGLFARVFALFAASEGNVEGFIRKKCIRFIIATSSSKLLISLN